MGFEKFGLVSYVSQTKISGFVEYLEAGKICGTRCLDCGCLEFPPRAHCRRCLSDRWEWSQLSGDCNLLIFTRVEAAPAAFKEDAPYTVGLAELSEGPKVLAWVDPTIPESNMQVGMKLKLRPTKLKDERFCYLLTRSESS